LGVDIHAIFHANFVSLKKLKLYYHTLAQKKNEIKMIKMTIIFFIKMIIIIKVKNGQNE